MSSRPPTGSASTTARAPVVAIPRPRRRGRSTTRICCSTTSSTSADIPGPYVLAGNSGGGILSIEFARAYGDDLAGLVLLDVPGPQADLDPDLIGVSPDTNVEHMDWVELEHRLAVDPPDLGTVAGRDRHGDRGSVRREGPVVLARALIESTSGRARGATRDPSRRSPRGRRGDPVRPLTAVSPSSSRRELVQRRVQPRDQPLPRLPGEVLLHVGQHLGEPLAVVADDTCGR